MSKVSARDKVRGCFLGIGIGDALGKPAEMMTAAKIAARWGRMTEYQENTEHKYYDGLPVGSWTDDTQLSLAVARGLISAGEINLDAIGEEHCVEFMKTVAGWGGTTREAVAKMVDGTPWNQAGHTDLPNRGVGNGVCMKAAPVGLYLGMTNPKCSQPKWSEDVKKLVGFATMTHMTSMAITSGFAQTFATFKCFKSDPANFDLNSFISIVASTGKMGRRYLEKTIGEHDIATRLGELKNYKDYPPERLIEEWKGSCYVYDSLPFSLMFFCRNPHSIETLYDCVSAGGDADTNGSMVGALLGALHGESIFPKPLVDGLMEKDVILKVADDFYEKFNG